MNTQDSRSLNDRLDEALGRIPLPHDYHLVVAEVSPTGEVSSGYRKLDFRRTSGRELPTAVLNVYPPPAAAEWLLLPVVRSPQGHSPNGKLVGTWKIWLPPPTDSGTDHGTLVRFEYINPDGLRCIAPNANLPEDLSWSQVLSLLPRQVNLRASRPLDVVGAIELSGPDSVISARVERLAALFSEILNVARSKGTESRMRFGFLGYRDHHYEPGIVDNPVANKVLLGNADDALEMVRNWRSRGLRVDRFGAPVEDMLREAASQLWRHESTKVLVTFGSRPPHPIAQADNLAMPCRLKLDWRKEINRLSQLHVELFAMVEPPPWSDPKETREWRERLPQSLGDHLDKSWETLGNGKLGTDVARNAGIVVNGKSGAASERVPLVVEAPIRT